MRKIKETKGFTLAELLIVVAIIAVLAAVAIPVFAAQLEKSREATDIANVRSAYAQCVTEVLANGTSSQILVPAQQTQADWQGTSGALMIQTSGSQSASNYSAKTKGENYTVSVSADGTVTVN